MNQGVRSGWCNIMVFHNDKQIELELPEYHRLPEADREEITASNPGPDLLQGETFNWESAPLITHNNLDEFFQGIYQYYCQKGLWCIFTQWLYELGVLGFTIIFSGFLVLFVNWKQVLNTKCGVDAIDEGKLHNCNSLMDIVIHEHPFAPFTVVKLFFVLYLAFLSLYWVVCFARFFYQLHTTLEVRHFIHHNLAISKSELQTMAWPALVDKIVQLQHEQLCIVRHLSVHDIVSRVMRKENYLIGMLNKGVLGLDNLPWWLPGAGPMLNQHDKKRLVLTKMVEWSLNWCILQHMFDRNFLVDGDFISNPTHLRKRLMVLGFAMLLVSPFYVLFMFFYFVLWNAESFYHNPQSMSLMGWSNLAKWNFREFNELEHMFKHRLNSSYKHAVEYVNQFPSPNISKMAEFVSYVTGAFAAVILFIYFTNESLLQGHIGRHNLVWYEFFFAGVLVLSRLLIREDYQVFNPVGIMQQISSHTHYMPKHWRGAENTETVRLEFEGLFKYKAALFFEEIMSIIVTPFILIFALPKCVEDVLQFVQNFTVHIEGVGHVCSLSVFDFGHHGNSKYGSPFHTSKDRHSSQGKMEKSFISFKTNYPNWEPDGNGKQLMSMLADFRQQNEENNYDLAIFSSHQLRPAGNNYPLIHTQGSVNYNSTRIIRDRVGINIPEFARPATGILSHNSDHLQRAGAENSEHMYWLDKFYTATSHELVSPQEYLDQAGLQLDEGPGGTVTDGSGNSPGINYLQQASTSRGNININILGTRDQPGFGADRAESTRWWAREGPAGNSTLAAPGESFNFEPPVFVRGHIILAESSQIDELDFESEEEHEPEEWSSQRHGRDENCPNLEFPFGDVYRRSREE